MGSLVTSGLGTLSLDECLERLASNQVGRIALFVDEYPLIVPVNYRLIDLPGRRWIAVRTRRGGVIERSDVYVAFEIDEIDRERRTGWSVVVRGTLHHVDPDAADFRLRFDPDSWVAREHDVWMVIDAFQITGRELSDPALPWELSP
jgi:nitroimidazol reductase NimA-like FMN-containing flavoprotein (pyridoxamine 5'-phosphate oxidase superfamily)